MVTLLKYVYRSYEILSEGNVIVVQNKVNIEVTYFEMSDI